MTVKTRKKPITKTKKARPSETTDARLSTNRAEKWISRIQRVESAHEQSVEVRVSRALLRLSRIDPYLYNLASCLDTHVPLACKPPEIQTVLLRMEKRHRESRLFSMVRRVIDEAEKLPAPECKRVLQLLFSRDLSRE